MFYFRVISLKCSGKLSTCSNILRPSRNVF